MFVIDLGVGINQTMKELLNKDYKYPFREACNLIFLEGRKSFTSTDYTKYGGLFNIGKLFESNYDYLCGKYLNEWVGDFLPFDSRFSYIFIDSTPLPQSHGLAWIGRISPTKNAYENEAWQKWEGSEERHPYKLASYFEQDFYDPNFLPYAIFDFRESISEQQFFNYKNIQIERCGKIKTSKVLVFPPKNLSKTGVWNLLDRVCDKLDLIDENRDIFIFDIPYNESHCYISALNEPQFKKRK